MRQKLRFGITLLLMLLLSLGGYSQRTKASLEKQIKSLQKEPADESADDLPESGYGEDMRAFVNIVL